MAVSIERQRLPSELRHLGGSSTPGVTSLPAAVEKDDSWLPGIASHVADKFDAVLAGKSKRRHRS